MFVTSFAFGQNLEIYLGENLAQVKKLLDQEKIEYREDINEMKQPYLIYMEEEGYVSMTIQIHFEKKEKNDFICNEVMLSMPYNSFLNKQAVGGVATLLNNKGYEKLADTQKLIHDNVFKSIDNDNHKKVHYLYTYFYNMNETKNPKEDDIYFFAGFSQSLNLISF
jgi:hypothetical protein